MLFTLQYPQHRAPCPPCVKPSIDVYRLNEMQDLTKFQTRGLCIPQELVLLLFFCLYTAFKGPLNIPLDYVSVFGDICRRRHLYNPNSYPKLALATQIERRDRHFKYEQKMFVPNSYAAYFLYLLIPSNVESTFLLRSQIQTINVSKAICMCLWKFHAQLS